MKILLLAGEESGVLYARRIMAELDRRRSEGAITPYEVRGYEDYGFQVSDLAVMGFWAVLKRLGFFLRVKRTMERAIDEWQPEVVCTIDYPGMNLKLARYAKVRGIRTVHVVAPQVWAWKKGRIPKIEAAVDKLLCFFPFEPEYFKPGLAEFVGHPLSEELREKLKLRVEGEGEGVVEGEGVGEGVVAVLPGSRMGEIERHLKKMLQSVKGLGVKVVIPAANQRAKRRIEEIAREYGSELEIAITEGQARAALSAAKCAVVASGTATLEAALLRCPTVLVYDIGMVMGWIGRLLIKGIKHVGLANIVWEKCAVGANGEAPMPELLQGEFKVKKVRAHLDKWLTDDKSRAEAVKRLDETMKFLEGEKGAISRIADHLTTEQ